MKWHLLRWLLMAVFTFGLLLVAGDGPLFPWMNLAGVGLTTAAMVGLQLDPEYHQKECDR